MQRHGERDEATLGGDEAAPVDMFGGNEAQVDATRFTDQGEIPAVADTNADAIGATNRRSVSDLAYAEPYNFTPDPTLGQTSEASATNGEANAEGETAMPTEASGAEALTLGAEATTVGSETETVGNERESEEGAGETKAAPRAAKPKLLFDLGWMFLEAIGAITSQFRRADKDNALIDSHCEKINGALAAKGFPAQAFVGQLLLQFRGALKSVDGDLARYAGNVNLAYEKGFLGANGVRLLREAVTGKREGATVNDAITRLWIENALNGGSLPQAVAMMKKGKMSARAIEAATQLVEHVRNTGAVGDFRSWVIKRENLTEAARKHDVITAWRNTDLLKNCDDYRKRYNLGPRTQSNEEYLAEVATRGPAKGSLEWSRNRLSGLIDDIKYLDQTMAARNYGSLHWFSSVYRHVALAAINKLPKLEETVGSSNQLEIDQLHDTVLRAATFKGIGGPRQLADYLTNANASTLNFMDKTAKIIGCLPGIGIPVTVVVGGTVELIKASQGQQSLETALTNIVTKALTDKFGKSLKATGPGPAILSAIMNGASSFVKSAAIIATNPATNWDNVGDQLRSALGRAMFDAFVSVIGQQAKAVNKENLESDFVDLIISTANEFGIKEQVKQYLDRELPQAPR